MGAPIATGDRLTRISPPQRLAPLSLRVPGDISSAAPWLVLGACHPDAEIVLRGVNTNPSRTGMLDIMAAMGADIELLEERSSGGEPVADVVVRSSTLHATTVSGGLVPRAIDELPLVAVLACFADGETVVRDASELLVKESNRVDAVVETLGRMGAKVTPREDGFAVRGPVRGLHGAHLDGRGDHRIGILGAIAASLAEGQTRIDNAAVEVSYPRFWADLEAAAEGGKVAL